MIKKFLVCFLIAALFIPVMAYQEEAAGFESLMQKYSENITKEHVTAFLEIPGAKLMLPVMQHPNDDGFYLKRNQYGEESDKGALYTEAGCNKADFSDPVTVIYGRRMADGGMFGSLQQWYSSSFNELRQINLYLPGENRQYTVIAAVPFSNMHLMYSYNFRYARMIEAFLDEVFAVRRPGAQMVEADRPENGESIIVLSTGLRGDATQRYLVIAKINRTEIN